MRKLIKHEFQTISFGAAYRARCTQRTGKIKVDPFLYNGGTHLVADSTETWCFLRAIKRMDMIEVDRHSIG